jgi:hypothetical protein
MPMGLPELTVIVALLSLEATTSTELSPDIDTNSVKTGLNTTDVESTPETVTDILIIGIYF